MIKFIYPCLPNTLSPTSKYFDELDKDTRWIGEVKKNGWRCEVIKDDDTVELWNRHGRLMLDPLEGIRDIMRGLPNKTMLDGEVKFSRRIKGQVEGYYLFDMLYWDGTVIHTQKLFRRRPLVEIIYKDYFAGSDIVELARQVEVGKKTLYYESIDGELNEGIVLKKLDAIYPISYETNKTCTEWLKVKKVEKHVKIESRK